MAVVAAIGGNSLVMVAKFVGFLFTGSGAMLSEAIHTLADLLNQVLLLVGIVRSGKQADEDFHYGYGSERYVWALISAVGIFFLGCGVTLYHGFHALLAPGHETSDLTWALAILAVSLLIEGYVLSLAVTAVKQAANGRPFWDYLQTEADPAAVAVILEDSAACLGVIIALVAIGLTKLTGQHYWDAGGTILIGLLLGLVAVWLISRNHALLVGPAIPEHLEEKIVEIIENNPSVEELVDFRTLVLDTDTYRVKADIRFDGATLAQKLRDRVEAAWPQIKDEEDFHRFAEEYADEIVQLLADEIDAIEKSIQKQVPKVQHLDLEAE